MDPDQRLRFGAAQRGKQRPQRMLRPAMIAGSIQPPSGWSIV
jgi:hypothetical protein